MRPLLVVLAYALALFAILYFFVIVPGQKKNKQTRAMHDSVKAGDKVTTIGGLIGTDRHRRHLCDLRHSADHQARRREQGIDRFPVGTNVNFS